MLKRVIVLVFSFIFVLTFFSGCTLSNNENQESKIYTIEDYTPEQLDSSKYDVDKYAIPFWRSNIVYNEIIFPIYNENSEIEPFQLMYDASEIVSVRDYSLNKTYVEGKDYILEDGKLVIIPEGEILVSGYSFIHREGLPDGQYPDLLVNINKDGTEYFDVYNNLIKKTIAVTYIHNDTWEYFTPQYYKKSLKRTISKLKKGKDTTIVVTGDSISVGYTSSKAADMPPYADAYVEMVVNYLTNYFNNDNIEIINSSVGGAQAIFTKEKLINDVINYNPNMVIIALGTNDVMAGRTTDDYISDINGRISFIKEKLPKCEIIIITPHLSNPRLYDIECYKDYRDALYELADKWKNVEICDPLAVEIDLIENTNKDFVSFSIDNLVHKNDYGMRIIAQCVIAALTE